VTLAASCAETGSSLQDIIDVGIRQGLETNAEKQTLIGYSDAPNVFGHRSFSPDEDSASADQESATDVRNVKKDRADIAEFVKAAKSADSYSAETCWCVSVVILWFQRMHSFSNQINFPGRSGILASQFFFTERDYVDVKGWS